MNDSRTKLTSLLAKSTINLETVTLGGDPVKFELQVLTGEKLLDARKLVLQRDMAGDGEAEGESLADVLAASMKMYARLAQLVIHWPDNDAPSIADMEHVITICGGLESDLTTGMLKCIGLDPAGGKQAERDTTDDLPS